MSCNLPTILIISPLDAGDRLVGHVLGAVGTLPPVFVDLEIKYNLMKRLVGLSSDTSTASAASTADKTKAATTETAEKIHRISKDEVLMFNIGSSSVKGRVTAVNKSGNSIKVTLAGPCCVDVGESVSISRSYKRSWRLIGCGK